MSQYVFFFFPTLCTIEKGKKKWGGGELKLPVQLI